MMKSLNIQSTVAEGLRVALSRQPDAQILNKWLALAEGELSFDDFYNWARNQNQLNCLCIDVTGKCDLTCKGFCIYNSEIDKNLPSPDKSLFENAITGAQQYLGTKNLCFTGKEPFLNPGLLFHLIKFAGAIKKTSESFSVGIISNGRNIHKQWEELEYCSKAGFLDYLDISLDSGYAEQHDLLRGVNGTYQLAYDALKQCQERLPHTRIGASSILRKDNHAGLLSFMTESADFNKNFFITPIIPPAYTSSEPPPSPVDIDDVSSFLKSLICLLDRKSAEFSIEVTVEFFNAIFLFDLAERGFFSWGDIKEDSLGRCYIQLNAGSSTVTLGFSVIPEYGWRIGRITYDGSYLTHGYFLQTNQPSLYSAGNIKNESISALYERGKSEGSCFHELTRSRERHRCRNMPCWQSCLGGWNGAEVNLLTGHSLEEKIIYCSRQG